MRITFELDSKFVAIEISDVEPEAEFRHVTLPVGFQLPPDTDEEDIDEEDEDPEADSARGTRARCTHGTFPTVPEAAKDLRSGGEVP